MAVDEGNLLPRCPSCCRLRSTSDLRISRFCLLFKQSCTSCQNAKKINFPYIGHYINFPRTQTFPDHCSGWGPFFCSEWWWSLTLTMCQVLCWAPYLLYLIHLTVTRRGWCCKRAGLQMKKWRLKRLRHWPKIAELLSGRASIKIQVWQILGIEWHGLCHSCRLWHPTDLRSPIHPCTGRPWGLQWEWTCEGTN